MEKKRRSKKVPNRVFPQVQISFSDFSKVPQKFRTKKTEFESSEESSRESSKNCLEKLLRTFSKQFFEFREMSGNVGKLKNEDEQGVTCVFFPTGAWRLRQRVHFFFK
jgi:hypothetical protein